MALPRNLATDEIIDEVWTDAVVDTLTGLDRVGLVGTATSSGSLAAASAYTDLVNGAVTFQTVAGRSYRVTAVHGYGGTPAAGATLCRCAVNFTGAGAAAGRWIDNVASVPVSSYAVLTGQYVFVGLGGPVTATMQGWADRVPTPIYAASMHIEDVGIP